MGIVQKKSVFRVCNLGSGKKEGVNPHSPYGTFVVLAHVRSHVEPSRRYSHRQRLRWSIEAGMNGHAGAKDTARGDMTGRLPIEAGDNILDPMILE
jgi:hypothetical protein